MSDRKCTCNHWIIKEHSIDLMMSGSAKINKCIICDCEEACLP